MAIVDLRYARALDEVVRAQSLSRDEVKAQLGDLQATLSGSRDLREVLENPSIPEDQKLRLLDAMAGRMGVSRTVRNFLAVVVHHGRVHELNDIVTAYLETADKENSAAEAEVTSARPLAAEERQAMEQTVLQLTGARTVRATYREDPTLLGGAVLKVGTTVYDGSVRAQLEQMKQKMMAAAG